MRSIAAAYHWPDFQPKIRAAVTVDPKILASYAGTYELTPKFSIVVTVEDGHLVTQGSGQGKVPMMAESETKFFPMRLMRSWSFTRRSQAMCPTRCCGKTGMRRRR
jgi:hypothetical protein